MSEFCRMWHPTAGNTVQSTCRLGRSEHSHLFFGGVTTWGSVQYADDLSKQKHSEQGRMPSSFIKTIEAVFLSWQSIMRSLLRTTAHVINCVWRKRGPNDMQWRGRLSLLIKHAKQWPSGQEHSQYLWKPVVNTLLALDKWSNPWPT